jgi:hypothetical protein
MCSTVSVAKKKGILPKTVLDAKGKEEQGLKPTSSTSTQKKIHCMSPALGMRLACMPCGPG